MIDRGDLRNIDEIRRNREPDAGDRSERESDRAHEDREADRRQPSKRRAGQAECGARKVVERRPGAECAGEAAIAIKSKNMRKICDRVGDPLGVVEVVVWRIGGGRIESQRDGGHEHRCGDPESSCHLAEFVSQLIESSKAFQKIESTRAIPFRLRCSYIRGAPAASGGLRGCVYLLSRS